MIEYLFMVLSIFENVWIVSECFKIIYVTPKITYFTCSVISKNVYKV